MRWLAIFSIVITSSLNAQMVNSGAQLSIAESTTIGIDGDFLNTGQVANEGLVFLKGNWMNVGVYNSSEGQLIFNSDEVQEIVNNGQEINNLIISNGVKTLNDDLVITDSLTLSSGILIVSEEAKLVLESDVPVEGASDESYIVGKLYRTGTGDLFYPIGTEDSYLPVTLVEVIGIDPEIGIEAHDTPPTQSIGGDLEELQGNRFWEVETDEGYTAGFITLPFESISTMDTSRLVVAQSVTADGEFNTLGRGEIIYNDGAGLITSKGNAIGPYFTLAYAPEVEPLPPLRVINALTPLQDGKHDFLRIENIELYPNNQVEVFDRSGIKVFSIKNYDNRERVFRGQPNVGGISELQDGNYFYTVKTGRTKVKAGFLFLKK